VLLALLSSLLLASSALAEEKPPLDSLKRELTGIEMRLLQGNLRETDLLEDIDARRHQVALQTELIRLQKRERQQLNDTLRLLENSLEEGQGDLVLLSQDKSTLEQNRQTIQAAFARHLSARCRLSRWETLEFLLGARSLGELVKRRQVLTNINRLEKEYLRQLTYRSRQLDLLQGQIVTQTGTLYDEYLQLEETRRDVTETEQALRHEQESLKRQQSQLATDLDIVRHDRDLLQKRRLEVQEALRQIEKMVATARDTTVFEGPIAGRPLTLLKGLLPWPVQGDVLVPFGYQKNRRFETVTDNPGIDISASASEEVRCVADGRAALCTWLRGFGNVIIIEHAGEFFTVYAHLQQLSVQRGDEVHAGQGLGTAGLDGISGQYRIHFELWEGKQKQNPLNWLTGR